MKLDFLCTNNTQNPPFDIKGRLINAQATPEEPILINPTETETFLIDFNSSHWYFELLVPEGNSPTIHYANEVGINSVRIYAQTVDINGTIYRQIRIGPVHIDSSGQLSSGETSLEVGDDALPPLDDPEE